MTFMRKILDFLNMDNWEKNKKTKIESSEDFDIITEEEIIESLRKQYYIVDKPSVEEYISNQTTTSDQAREEKNLRSERSEETKSTDDRSVPDTQTEVLYHDRFDEEYREANNYREITFTGKREFDIPEVKLCAAILLSGNQNGSEIRNNDEYSLYFEGRYGIVNISTLHRWLYEQGYFRKANFHEAINLCKIPELKTILESIGLKKTGKKADLIERIENNIDDDLKSLIASRCDRLFITEKGVDFLEENGDYYMWHKKSYGVTFEEFNKHRLLQGKRRKFHDTIFNVLSQKAAEYQVKGYFSQLEMIYFWLAESLYDDEKYDLAIRYYIYRLYFSTNLAYHVALFDVKLVKFYGVEKEQEYIKSLHETFNQGTLDRLIELKDYYNDHILDIVYDLQMLPYCIFDKMDMADAIHDLLNRECFDADHYTNYICIKYENYIKQFL